MKLFETLRQKTYWLIDRLKGNAIGNELADISFIMNHYGQEEVNTKRKTYLYNILDYATNNIQFYKQYQGFKSLSDFPIVNKNIIRDNENLFFNSTYNKETLFRQATSGSTGMPFVVWQDSAKRRRATADTLFFSEMAHYHLGSRLYFSRVWEKGTERSRIKCIAQNWITHDSSNLSDESIESFIEAIEKDNSTKSILIFASTLASIAKYLEENNYHPKAKVESFITLSESLDLTTKHIIQERYKAPVVSRYSDQELGILAQQCFDSDEFHINIASYYVELLDLDSDNPVEPGQLGRIVVTDFFNHSMPLIRYDTGDIGIMKQTTDCGFNTPCFERIDGRRVDFLYDTKGNKVSPYVINSPMHVYMEIQQYQFIQENEKQYSLLLNIPNGKIFNRESEMLEMLHSYLGDDAEIKVSYVDEIPVLKSGKRKQVVNTYKPV